LVTAGLYLGHRSLYAGPGMRVQDSSVWASIDMLLEALVFALIGLQLPFVLQDVLVNGRTNATLIKAAIVVLLVTIAVRVLYVFATGYLPRALWLFRTERDALSWRELAVVSWTGTRGVVTLAAAAGVPIGTPGRGEIQLFAFTVAISTLLIQGLTLPVLIRVLHVRDSDEVSRDAEEELEARGAAMKAASVRLDEILPDLLSSVDISSERADKFRTRLHALIETRYRFAAAAISLSEEEREESPHAAFVKARKELLITQREALLAERDAGKLEDDVLRRVLRELDLEELALSETLSPRLS
jgi:CPA1 family monovalent cation:H+ antiporter